MKKILYIGRIAIYKGIHDIIGAMPEVVKFHQDAKLLIRGQISTGRFGDYHLKLLTLIRNSPVKSKIKYLPGRIKEPEKKKLIKEADVIVCASFRGEGFGLLPVEILKYNGILVCSDIFVETGAISRDVAFVYPKNSVKELSKKIIEALSLSPKQKEEQKKKAKQWASNFTWDKHIDELEKILQKLKK